MAEKVETVNHMLLEALDRHAAQVCFSVKSSRLIQNVTYRQFRKWVFRLSWYLQNQPHPKARPLRIAIVARNSPEWMAAYVGGGCWQGCWSSPFVRRFRYIRPS